MIKKLLFGLVIVSVFLPTLVNAATTNCSWVGTIWSCNSSDPNKDWLDKYNRDQQALQQKMQQDQQQRSLIQQQLDMLKSQYGFTDFTICYGKSGILNNSMRDDPSVMQSALNYTRSCLETKAILNNLNKNQGSYNSNPAPTPLPAPTSQPCTQDYFLANGTKVLCLKPIDPSLSQKWEDMLKGKPSTPTPVPAPIISQPAPQPVPPVEIQNNNPPKTTPKPIVKPKSEVKPKAETILSPQVKGESTTTTQPTIQVPEKKPSVFKRIVNFFKNLF